MVYVCIVLMLPVCVVIYSVVGPAFSDYVLFGLFPSWMEWLIRNYPGRWFIPAELSLDAVVALSNSLGNIVGVMMACLAASFGTLALERKARSKTK